ncbi:ninein-like protein isoform X6 [Motacilla alba alba]|uniref:ninein-like protein isoform X6 n=1 Tax=Motacilla alba alba TaxID=1094192 RepID=UPI0018D4DFF2|nr:ninein-like protein isoform X6 [Motacilla alba alba]
MRFVKRILADGLDLQLHEVISTDLGIRGERSGKQPVLLAKLPGPTSLLQPQLWICQASTCHCHLSPGRARRRSSGSLALPGSLVVAERQSSSTEQQVSLAGLPAAWDNTLMVPRSGLQPAADTSYRYKLQCLWNFQAEIEAKELLLQQAVSHQAKLEAAAQLLQGKEANLQGRLNHVMNENTQLQNKVTEMAEKLSASEEMVLDLQKELNHIVKDKLEQGEPHSPEFLKQSERFAEIVLEYERQCQRVKVLYEQNGALRRELQRLRLQLQDSGAERELPAAEMSLPVEHLQEQLQDLKVQLETKCDKGKEELSHPDVTRPQLGSEPPEHKAGHSDGSGTAQLQSQSLLEAECLRGAEIAARLEHHQRHAACWMEMELLQQQLQASQEKLLEAKASLSLAQAQHALQLQQARAQINNMVPKKQFEQLQNTLREEQCKTQQLQESLQLQAEQTCRQLVRTQEEHERLLQAAVEQAEGLEQSLRNAEAVLAERAAQLRDAQAQLSRNKLLIEELRGENRRFAMALQAAELKQKSMEEKNQLLEEQASALKQLIGKITPASLSG